jgi:20S proteasome alpha/beta subunit
VRYDAKAIGSGSEAAQSELQDKWHSVRPLVPHNLLRNAYLHAANDLEISTDPCTKSAQASHGRKA